MVRAKAAYRSGSSMTAAARRKRSNENEMAENNQLELCMRKSVSAYL
jgi:hypothetical protein